MKKMIWLAMAIALLAIVLVYPGLVSIDGVTLPVNHFAVAADNTTASDGGIPVEESIWDMFPMYVWIILLVVVVIVIGLIVFLVMTPPKKKGKGAPVKGGKAQAGARPLPKGRPGEEPARRPMQQGMQGMPGEQFPQQGEMQAPQPGGPGGQQFPGQQPFPQQGFAPQQRPQQPGMLQQPGMPQQQMPGQQPPQQQMPTQQGMPPRAPQAQPMPQQFPGQAPTPQQPFPQQPFPQSASGGPGRQPGPMAPQLGGPQPVQQPYPQPGGQPQQPFAPQRFQPGQPGQQMSFTPQQMPPQAPVRPQPVTPQPMGVPRPGQPMGMPPTRFTAPAGNRPSFAVSNLNILPREVKEDDAVTISITVTNSSAVAGQYSVVFKINHVVENITELSLTPGASQTTEFTVSKESAGEYFVEVDSLRGMFTVLQRIPASFEISDLTVVPERVKQGQPIAIGFIVTNTGERPGVYHANLLIKGMSEATEEIQMEEGETKQVTFNIVKDTAGFYPVSIEGLTGRFVVEMDWREQGM